PLQTIPFELFVTSYEPAERAAFESRKALADGSAAQPYLGEYAGLQYLAARHRFAYLPSLSSLASQRLYPKRASVAKLELVAFADPMFNPEGDRTMPSATIKALARLNVGLGRTEDGAPSIPRLAETADEAKEIARVLGGRSQIYTGAEAQERVAKAGELRTARFVLFATHGFLGGEYLASDLPSEDADARRSLARSHNAQPALALTLVG